MSNMPKVDRSEIQRAVPLMRKETVQEKLARIGVPEIDGKVVDEYKSTALLAARQHFSFFWALFPKSAAVATIIYATGLFVTMLNFLVYSNPQQGDMLWHLPPTLGIMLILLLIVTSPTVIRAFLVSTTYWLQTPYALWPKQDIPHDVLIKCVKVKKAFPDGEIVIESLSRDPLVALVGPNGEKHYFAYWDAIVLEYTLARKS